MVVVDKLCCNIFWGIYEFGFYDFNGNVIFIVEDVQLFFGLC